MNELVNERQGITPETALSLANWHDPWVLDELATAVCVVRREGGSLARVGEDPTSASLRATSCVASGMTIVAASMMP